MGQQLIERMGRAAWAQIITKISGNENEADLVYERLGLWPDPSLNSAGWVMPSANQQMGHKCGQLTVCWRLTDQAQPTEFLKIDEGGRSRKFSIYLVQVIGEIHYLT